LNLLSPDVIAILMLDAILFLFALIALAISVQIVRKWDRSATTPLQYALEKRAYLVATIIEYIFYLKLPLFLYFIYTLDLLSNILPGAMCAAGVTNATVYGMPLFVVKILSFRSLDCRAQDRYEQTRLSVHETQILVFHADLSSFCS